MAGASLLVLLDDIATVLDDVALMTKVAAKKTAGVLGDDLALNAQQVSGVRAERELPVVWAVAKGSALNKLILVPAALLISAFIPWLITPLLIVGGAYLCYEGVEKIAHAIFHKAEQQQQKQSLKTAIADPTTDMVAFEKNKIKGAIRTDFVLSAEIIVIALGTVQGAAIGSQIAVVVAIAAVMTIGVYGFVAIIVKLDDAGLYLLRDERVGIWASLKRKAGSALLAFCPWLMKGLSVVGTLAMFLVGGGIVAHGLPILHHATEVLVALALSVSALGGVTAFITPLLFNCVVGLLVGAAVLALVAAVNSATQLLKLRGSNN